MLEAMEYKIKVSTKPIKNVRQQNLTWNKRRAADTTQLDACHDVFILDFDLRVPLCQYLQRHCMRTDDEIDHNRMDASR